ncbi:hypothetical protein Tco_0438333 [Tanacetum coccineum]
MSLISERWFFAQGCFSRLLTTESEVQSAHLFLSVDDWEHFVLPLYSAKEYYQRRQTLQRNDVRENVSIDKSHVTARLINNSGNSGLMKIYT